MLREAVVHRSRLIGSGLRVLHPERIVGRKIALVDEFSDSLFAEVVVALIDRDFVDPGEKRASEVKILYREVDLGKDLLGNVFGIITVAKNPIDDGEHFGLIAVYDLAKGQLVLSLYPPD